MRILLTGASGQLGAYLIDRLRLDGHEVIPWSGSETGHRSNLPLRPVDLTDPVASERALAEGDPDLILHAAAMSAAEGVRRDPGRARAVNVEATGRLAGWCVRHGRRLVFTSTDMVFDGERIWSRESDPASPGLAYGRSKVAAEETVLGSPGVLVARLPLLFGPSRCGRTGFFDASLEAMRRGEPRTFFEDEWRTPLHLAVAADLLARLIGAGASGLLHVAGAERVSRFDLMRRAAIASGIDPGMVRANRRADAPGPEPRPGNLSLDTSLLAATLPDLVRPSIEASLAGNA